MEMRAVEILISSIGVALSCLDIEVPHFELPAAERVGNVQGEHLSSTTVRPRGV